MNSSINLTDTIANKLGTILFEFHNSKQSQKTYSVESMHYMYNNKLVS
jgi:hypothetical protein